MVIFNTFFSRLMGIEAVKRQSVVSFVWQIAFTLIGFISTIYFAHAVGASVLGAYFLFLAYYELISIVIDGGFGQAAIKRISEGEESDAYFSSFFVINFLSITVVVVALIAFRSYFVDLNSAGIFIWFLLALLVSLLYRTVSFGIGGSGKVGIQATCNFINDTSRVLIQIIAIFFGYGVAGLAGGFVAGMFISAIIELHFFDLHFVRFGWKHIKSLSTFSFWFFLTSSGWLVFSYADIILIGYFQNNSDVGVYRVVMQFTSFALLTTAALKGTLWPKVSRWGKTGDFGSIEESLSRAFSYSLILAVPILAGGIILGDKLLFFLYGAEFEQGYLTLFILLIVQVINIFQNFFTMYLGALDNQKEAFNVTALAVLMNIMLNLMLIPLIGILGAAIATLITMILNAILARKILSKMITIRFEYKSFLNILKASFVMSLFVGSYRIFVTISNAWLIVIPVVIGALIYFILILKFDRKISYELKDIFTQMNVTWPNWL
jgi:O-antigen/teichoic acid export membrane protein